MMSSFSGTSAETFSEITRDKSTLAEIPKMDYFNFVLYQVFVPVLFGLITLIGVIGNALVIRVILAKDRMRTVTNLLLLNLAIADLCFIVVIPTFTAYQFATAGWPFGSVMCKLMHYLVNVTAYVTVYTIVLVSFVRSNCSIFKQKCSKKIFIGLLRYATVVHGTSTAWIRTKRNTCLMLIGVWALMLSLNVPIFLSYGLRGSTDNGDLPDCDIESMIIGRQIYSTFFTFAYVIPLAAVVLLYIGILRHVAGARRRADGSVNATKYTSTLRGTASHVGRSSAALLGRRQSSSAQRRRQLGRLLMLVVVLFAALWLPIHVHLLLAYFGTIPDSRAYEVVSVLWNSLAYINSCVNPFVYNYTSKEFRDAFRRHTTGFLCPRIGSWRESEDSDGCRVWRRRGREPQITLSTTCDRVHVKRLMHDKDSHMESNVDIICKVVIRQCSFEDGRTCNDMQLFENTTVNPAGDIIVDPVAVSGSSTV